jgi:VanZ family protein
MRTKWSRVAVIVFLCALFGFLMSIRQELAGLWLRAGVAAAAGAVIGVALVVCRKPSLKD